MKAGSLNRLITVEKKQISQEPVYGTDLITWVPLIAQPGSPVIAERFHAEVQDVPPGRSESVALGLVTARNQTRIRLRWRNDITSDMRITLHGDTDVIYQIVAGPAEVDGRKELIEMVCERYS